MDEHHETLVQRALENQSPELEKLLELIATMIPSMEPQNEQEKPNEEEQPPIIDPESNHVQQTPAPEHSLSQRELARAQGSLLAAVIIEKNRHHRLHIELTEQWLFIQYLETRRSMLQGLLDYQAAGMLLAPLSHGAIDLTVPGAPINSPPHADKQE